MRRIHLALAAAVTLTAACYHVTVLTGLPEGPTVIDKPWQNSFVIGLVPPDSIDAKPQCNGNVAKVETEQSFLNGLVAGLTWQIYTPIHVRVTCASGPRR